MKQTGYTSEDTPLDFPAKIAMKVMIENDPVAAEHVVAWVADYFGDRYFDYSSRDSRTGRYCSLTLNVEAISHSELEAAYVGVKGLPKVVMAL